MASLQRRDSKDDIEDKDLQRRVFSKGTIIVSVRTSRFESIRFF